MGKKDVFEKMKNSFSAYEKEYYLWKKNFLSGHSYDKLGIKKETLDFLKRVWKPPATPDFPLYDHQKESILRIVFAYEIIRKIDSDRDISFKHLLLDIVTGGGKTAIIGLAVVYLRECHGVDKFLILTPNTIVRDRLEDDFCQKVEHVANKTIFEKLGIFSLNEWEENNRYYDTAVTTRSSITDLMNKPIILSNVQQLYYSENSSDNSKQRLAAIYNNCDKLAVFNDEAHNTKAEEYENILLKIRRKTVFSLDTTATPERADGKIPDSRKIFEFGVREALKQNLIKHTHVFEPVIQDYEFYDEETGKTIRLEDMSEEEIEEEVKGSKIVTKDPTIVRQLEIALDRLKDAEKRAVDMYKPLLFIITRGINDANRVRDILTGEPLKQTTMKNPFGFRNDEVLVVTEESDEETREEVRLIRKNEKSFVKAVISVQMLREGWDVSEVSIILLLRKFSSRVYGQQVIGRGLRKVEKSNLKKIEVLSVVDFPKLDHDWLWKIMFAEKHSNIKKGDEVPVNTKFEDEIARLEELIIKDEDFEKVKADFSDLENKSFPQEEIRDWKKIIAGFSYNIDRKTLKDIRYGGIVDKDLKSGFETESNYESKIDATAFHTKSNRENLITDLKQIISDDAEKLLNLTGHPITEKQYIYSVILEHISDKFFAQKPISEATLNELERALNHLSDVIDNFSHINLIDSMIKYRE